MPTIQMEESRRRRTSEPSTCVEPTGTPGELSPGSDGGLRHLFVAGGEDDKGRTVCDLCGQLWEDKGHDHDVQAPVSPRMSAEQRWVIEARGEIDDYMVLVRKLRSLPPDEVFLELSGITARLTELRLMCVRSESRRLAALRTREIDPLIEECERQFRFHSRIQACRTMEADLTRNLT